ncbi:TonB-dependent receptor [Dyella japonica]|uniref:Iron complex outermembrane receptor protein n=1 Tax=Dyella japonica TaxID=231455 RepID=A0ABV2K218_9GAMM
MKRKMLSQWVAAVLAGGVLVSVPAFAADTDADAPAQAQSGTTNGQNTAAPAATKDLQAVTVTAEKRVENLQKVPVAVAVINTDQLAAYDVRDFNDLNRVAPSLVIKPAENPVNASLTIRGVGTFAFSIGVEPSVAVVVDDVPIAFQPRAFTDLSDIAQIEVLRGPQSTLYGKSASAGLINITTLPPTDTLTASVSALTTNDGEMGGSAVFSGPLAEHLGFRSSWNYDNFGGNVTNKYNGNDVNGRRTLSTRNKLVWDPTDQWNVTAGFDYIDGHTTTGRPFIALAPNANLRGIYAPSVFAPGITPGPDNTDVSNNYTTGTDYTDTAGSVKVSYDFANGGPTLMSITSYDSYKMFDRLDQDESALKQLDNRQFGTFASHQTTQEFRLLSPGDDRFRYTLGLFYADVDYSRNFGRGPYYSLASWYATSSSKQYAGFGQIEYDLWPGTTLILGGRESYEKIGYTFNDYLAKTAFNGSNGDNFGTYKAGIQQQVTDDFMLYFTTASGHKGETYDLSTGFNAVRAAGGPVKPETSTDYELGARMQFLDRHLTLNTTLFDTRYKDFQAQGIETLSDGTTNYRLANVGKLHTRGVELESSYHVNQDLTFGANATYLDAEITSFPFAQCYPNQTVAQGCTGTSVKSQNLAGARPPLAPKWKFDANFNYTHPLGGTGLLGVVNGSYTYQSEVNYSLSQDPMTVQGGYGIANFSIGVREESGRWEVMGFVNNAFDKHYYSNLTNSTSNYANQLAVQSYLPRDFERYFGIRATYNFQ